MTRVVQQVFKKKKNIDIRTGVAVHGHEPTPRRRTTVAFGDGETIETDLVVVSVGRSPTRPT